jgi:zinc transporter ZupT
VIEETEEKKYQLYNLSPLQRVIIAIAVVISFILDKPYSNFIMGGIAGVLLYPMVEYFLYVTFHDKK